MSLDPAKMSWPEFWVSSLAVATLLAMTLTVPWLGLFSAALAGSAWCLAWLWDSIDSQSSIRKWTVLGKTSNPTRGTVTWK